MIKKILITFFISFLFALDLFASSNDEDFTVCMNDWYCSVQWNDEVELQYLNKQETYYNFLKTVSENYDFLAASSDSILFYIQSYNEKFSLTVYFNDKKTETYSFSNLKEFQSLLSKHINEVYNLTNKTDYFYLYKVQVPIQQGDIFRNNSQIKLNSSAETSIIDSNYEYFFLRTDVLKDFDEGSYKMKTYKIILKK